MMETRLLVGDKVEALISDENFLEQWKALVLETPGVTVFQEPSYVKSWYEIYKKFIPVFSLSYSASDKLIGLMCLAWHPEKKYITHSGDYEAEYNGWLSAPEHASAFVEQTLQLVKSKFTIKKWKWAWIPPGTLIDDLKFVNRNGINSFVETRKSLLWNLNKPGTLQRLLKSRSIRSKFNRYKKRGDFRTEMITDPQRINEVLQIAAIQCDIRQKVIYSTSSFEDHPEKIPFCVELLSHPSITHAITLWLDDRLLALNLGIIHKKRVCLGLTCFDPSESKNSPGTLLLLEWAKELTAQGYEILDLTPGVDAYKKRYANDSQILLRPTFIFNTYTSVIEGAKYALKMAFFKSLPFFKSDIYHAYKQYIKFKNLYVNFKAANLRSKLMDSLYRKDKILVYYIPSSAIKKLSAEKPIKLQAYQDLLTYSGQFPFVDKRSLYTDAIDKFGKGYILLTHTDHNELIWMAWYGTNQKSSTLQNLNLSLPIEKGSKILYDIYYHKSLTTQEFLKYLMSSIKQLSTEEESGLNIILTEKDKLDTAQLKALEISSMIEFKYFRLLKIFKRQSSEEIEKFEMVKSPLNSNTIPSS